MTERTEELGLAGRLPISVGGQPVVLRTLSIEESEDWLEKLAASVARFDIPESENSSEIFAAFAKQPTRAMLELVDAYDVDGQLDADYRKRMTKRELYEAVKQMVRAEAPFVEDARSAVEAFGPQLRGLVAIALDRLGDRFRQANSTNGHSLTGDSIPELSAKGSRKRVS